MPEHRLLAGMLKFQQMPRIDFTADHLSHALLGLAESEGVCILDSCGVGHLGSHLMIAGLRPVETIQISSAESLSILESKFNDHHAVIFTLSYDLPGGNATVGRRPDRIPKSQVVRPKEDNESDLGLGTWDSGLAEPAIFASVFDTLILHDYDTGETRLTGNESKFGEIEAQLNDSIFKPNAKAVATSVTSNFSRSSYTDAVETIREYIRSGDTYQTNLTQQIRAALPADLTPREIFHRLRRDHPAPFAAFIRRGDSTVVSVSPERFLRIENGRISASPIKGTRPRGSTKEGDAVLRNELETSEKDRAENTMIVDLLRNDLGRVCEFGSVRVEKLCDVEEHPSLFHLVSTVSGKLRENTSFAEIVNATFPCGSITGAPKIRTMQIIEEIEQTPRGLSMGAIGYWMPESFGIGTTIDLSVAIRTMVVRNGEATFNVGGGVVIDSDPEKEYEESLLKAKALMSALGIETFST